MERKWHFSLKNTTKATFIFLKKSFFQPLNQLFPIETLINSKEKIAFSKKTPCKRIHIFEKIFFYNQISLINIFLYIRQLLIAEHIL